MKTKITMLGAVALATALGGCASSDGVRYSDSSDIYREQYPSGDTLRTLPWQNRHSVTTRRVENRLITAREPEQHEITKTQQALAMRIRAMENRPRLIEQEEVLNRLGEIPPAVASGSVGTSVRRDIAAAAAARQPLPVDYYVGNPVNAVDPLYPEPVAERRTIRSRNLPPPAYATRVPGQYNYVRSPFAPSAGYIDVRGLPSGSQARDPYTGKVFTVP